MCDFFQDYYVTNNNKLSKRPYILLFPVKFNGSVLINVFLSALSFRPAVLPFLHWHLLRKFVLRSLSFITDISQSETHLLHLRNKCTLIIYLCSFDFSSSCTFRFTLCVPERNIICTISFTNLSLRGKTSRVLRRPFKSDDKENIQTRGGIGVKTTEDRLVWEKKNHSNV